MVVDVEGYGVCGWEGRSNLYFDLMYAPVISYSDNIRPDYPRGGKELYTKEDLDKAISKKPLGWRIGYVVNYKGFMRAMFGAEIGSRPGVNGGAFMLMKFGFPLFGFDVMNFSKKE